MGKLVGIPFAVEPEGRSEKREALGGGLVPRNFLRLFEVLTRIPLAVMTGTFENRTRENVAKFDVNVIGNMLERPVTGAKSSAVGVLKKIPHGYWTRGFLRTVSTRNDLEKNKIAKRILRA